MPAVIKNHQQINNMIAGGKILNRIFQQLEFLLKPGVTTLEIDQFIDDQIKKNHARCGFKTISNYNYASCISINHQVVHTMPSHQKLMPSDIITIDAGVLYQGMHTDKAITYQIAPKTKKITDFLNIGKTTLNKAIKKATIGNYIGDISKTIQDNIEKAGYKTIYELTGHGVGFKLHEDPSIPGFCFVAREKTQKLVSGMTLAIEVIYSTTTNKIKPEKNRPWSLVTADNSLSACFENTIALTKNKTLILT